MNDDGSQDIPYMQRTRAYYRALGYDNDYVWAHFADVPFTRPTKSLGQMRIALVTTAGPPDRSNRNEKGRKRVWSGEVDAPPATFDTDLAWDKESTHTDDRETFLPIGAMGRLVGEGVVGSLAPHFIGAPTDYSHAKTLSADAPEILRRVQADGADAALLTAL
ncbi:MAG: glycine/sarcosine/betaine reductase selenoprotein B family protein [Hyphomicrobiaceae bacterium]|nr:glycine/sarcosine/betaine reductase selenoprotein B family protein [Hyphomicrobiaceae bacterium]